MTFRAANKQAEAVVLFNGRDLSNWGTRHGRLASWKVEDGILHVVPGAGDIMTKELLTDFLLHLEFRCPDMQDAEGHELNGRSLHLKFSNDGYCSGNGAVRNILTFYLAGVKGSRKFTLSGN